MDRKLAMLTSSDYIGALKQAALVMVHANYWIYEKCCWIGPIADASQ